MGRPPLPPDQRSVTTVGVRLLGVDHAAMRALLALPTPLAADASGLLRELLRREARAQGFLPPDPQAKVSEPPSPSVTMGGPSSAPGPQGAPLPAALLGGLLPPGALLLVWPPGWPLPVPSPYAGVAVPGMVPPVHANAPDGRPGSISAPTSPPPTPPRTTTATASPSSPPRRSANTSRESTPEEPYPSVPELSSAPRSVP
jgi:hypothetical protein